MGPGEHRPHDHEYRTPPWSTTLCTGDLFEAVPFGDQPTVIYAGQEEPIAGKHFVGEVAFGYGLLVTPTCDMTDQRGGGQQVPQVLRDRAGRSDDLLNARISATGGLRP